jgi:hypothetical protein
VNPQFSHAGSSSRNSGAVCAGAVCAAAGATNCWDHLEPTARAIPKKVTRKPTSPRTPLAPDVASEWRTYSPTSPTWIIIRASKDGPTKKA